MKQQPFFAKFLENQVTEETKKELMGGEGPGNQTMKAPSDADELGPISMTLKYPSDIEDSCPLEPPMTTQKYPSDAEDV